jgi:hypothetical protein
MQRRTLKRATFITVLGALFGAALASGAVIAGTVVDDAIETHISKPSVRVFGGPRYANDVAVKDDGSFETEDLKPGDYAVAAGRPGYVYSAMRSGFAADVNGRFTTRFQHPCYRAAARTEGLMSDSQAMNVEITAAGIAEVDLATPKAPVSGQ